MYDRTGLSTKCTLIKTGFKNLRTGTEAKFRPFVDALFQTKQKPFCFTPYSNSLRHLSLPMKVSLRDWKRLSMTLIFAPRERINKSIVAPTSFHSTLSKNGRKFRDAFVYIFFQASWAKNFDLLRVIAVNGTITIEFYVEFWVTGQNFSLLGPTLLWF